MKSFYYTTAVVFLSLTAGSGCSVSKLLVGNVDPVDQKSSSIQITPVEIIDPHWKRVDISENATGAAVSVNDMPDRAWQSTKSASVISLNSSCRQKNDEAQGFSEMDPKEITSALLSQWNEVQNQAEKDLVVSGFPAFETTADGIYFNRKRKFQTVIVKTPTCVYDLIFLAPPKNFTQDLVTFQKFRDKLVIK